MGVKSDDEVDHVPLDVADEGLVAAREGHTHRLRDPRELEPLEESHAELAVGEVDGVRVDGAPPSVGRRRLGPVVGVVPVGHVGRVGRTLGGNSIDILNFGHETGLSTGPCSGPSSVLGYFKFRHV